MAFSFGSQPAASTSTTNPAFGGSTFSFGSTNTANQNTPATGTGTGTSLFGQPAQQPAQQPSLFGNTNTTATGAGTGTGTTGGGLFGNTNTTGTSTGGGLFGNTTTGTTGGGLFGNTNTNTAGTTGGGLFGNTGATNTTTTGATPSLFGSTTTVPATGGLFGATANTAQPASGGFFGSTTTPAAGTSLFGSKPSLFGQPAATQPNPLAQSTLTASTLGQPAPAQPTNNLQVSVFGTPGAAGLTLEQRIENIAQAWNPVSPSCRFQYYFYNLVDQPQNYGRPANATNEQLWKRAVSENPNPERLVPALALGFDDLKKRVTLQESQSKTHIAALAQLRTRLTEITQKHAESHTTRLARAAQQHTELARRVRALARQLHMLIPNVRRSALGPEEDELRRKLGALEEGAGLARMGARMNELWAAMGSVQAVKERAKREGNGSTVEWAVVDEEGLVQIAQILRDQQNGLAHVTKILQEDLRALKVTQEGIPSGHYT